MRFAALVAALVTALIAAGLGLDIIHAGDSLAEQSMYCTGWGFLSLALVAFALAVGDR